MMSDISLEEKDVIQSIGRRAFLQFTTLDYLISKTYEAIAKIVMESRFDRGFSTKGVVFNNPYQLDTCIIEWLNELIEFEIENTRPELPPDNSSLSSRIEAIEKQQPESPHRIAWVLYHTMDPDHPTEKLRSLRFIDVFKIYTICITLQRILSYSILNPRRMYDFRVEQELQSAERASNIYGTQDDVNDEASKYLAEVLRQKILDELKDANSGMPIEEDIKEAIVKMVLHIGHLFSNDNERVEQGLEGGIREDVIEDSLVHSLFPMDYKRGSDPAVPEHDVHLLNILEISGLKSIIDTLELSLPDDVYAIASSSVLTKLVNTWGMLFTEHQPEAVDLLVNMLPTIKDRFRSSVTKSETQQDLKDDAFEVIEEFLDETLIPIRTNDLDHLLNSPSATSSLYFFRSLRVLMANGQLKFSEAVLDPEDGIPPILIEEKWNAVTDITARIKFLRLIHWILTDDKELEEIIEYALRLKAASHDKDGVSIDVDEGFIKIYGHPVIPGVIFPGTLEMADVIPGGGMLMDMNYAREQKNKQLLKTRLKRSGGLEGAVKDARVRWMP
jgi:hypothetical protein